MTMVQRAAWGGLDGMNAAEAAGFVQRVEGLGYGALWIPDALGREPLSHASWLLANTTKLVIATGIVNIYGRDARAARAAQMSLNEQSGGRFLLGLGVSHKPFVEGFRGHVYGPPLEAMRRYLDAMKEVQYMAPQPPETPRTVIAALGPKMLELARTHADGAHPYLVTPEHTAEARRILGEGKLLCVEQKVLLERDAATARAIGRKALAIYLPMPNYRNNLLRLGFSAEDIDVGGGSDRLVDGLIAWGDEAALERRVQAHLDAGADQVCIHALSTTGTPDERALQALAPGR
ncbi:TIGR03620 family F420-dependent LLM class oxidoreductase [Iodidimonas sp. SYSU 1G8]|uniref:TIGR03620 family F420-dependent LLM class oxidoreductase n=1 Tax=Iodidimonas sp. SYSU 1G8 TaxID=3133967 RepID=UPI0031FEAD83